MNVDDILWSSLHFRVRAEGGLFCLHCRERICPSFFHVWAGGSDSRKEKYAREEDGASTSIDMNARPARRAAQPRIGDHIRLEIVYQRERQMLEMASRLTSAKSLSTFRRNPALRTYWAEEQCGCACYTLMQRHDLSCY